MTNKTIEERFWEKVDIKIGHCWEWTRHKDKDGYGRLRANNKDLRAHRLSWEINNNKPVPPGMSVIHSCDNPSCVNPAHLSVGTNKENTLDSIRKGRSYSAQLLKRTHCKFGHEYTEENTYMVLGRKRRCRACSAVTAKRFRERRDANG